MPTIFANDFTKIHTVAPHITKNNSNNILYLSAGDCSVNVNILSSIFCISSEWYWCSLYNNNNCSIQFESRLKLRGFVYKQTNTRRDLQIQCPFGDCMDAFFSIGITYSYIFGKFELLQERANTISMVDAHCTTLCTCVIPGRVGSKWSENLFVFNLWIALKSQSMCNFFLFLSLQFCVDLPECVLVFKM